MCFLEHQMNMQTKVEVKLQTDKNFIKFLSKLSDMSEDEVVCNMYDLTSDSLKKVLSEEFSKHWTTKRIRFPNTDLDLLAKVKFVNYSRFNKKVGDVYITFHLPKTKTITFTEQQIADMAVEKFLLNINNGDTK